MALGVAHYEMLLTNSRECNDSISYLLTSLHMLCTIMTWAHVLFNFMCTCSLYLHVHMLCTINTCAHVVIYN